MKNLENIYKRTGIDWKAHNDKVLERLLSKS